MRRKKRLSKPRTLIAAAGLLIAGALFAAGHFESSGSQTEIEKNIKIPTPQAKTPAVPEPDKQMYSVDDAASLWAIVNKGRKLPSGYIPDGLRAPDIALGGGASDANMKLRDETADALEAMTQAAASDGASLRLTSGYRSYSTQISVYDAEVRNYGKAQADKQSARPGHSEHQTGLAADLEPISGKCRLSQCFADTVEGLWLAAHAHEHGFLIRYVKGGESLTGYMYEPWHLRYVGAELARKVYASRQTLEQYFELPFYPSYPNDIYHLNK